MGALHCLFWAENNVFLGVAHLWRCNISVTALPVRVFSVGFVCCLLIINLREMHTRKWKQDKPNPSSLDYMSQFFFWTWVSEDWKKAELLCDNHLDVECVFEGPPALSVSTLLFPLPKWHYVAQMETCLLRGFCMIHNVLWELPWAQSNPALPHSPTAVV